METFQAWFERLKTQVNPTALKRAEKAKTLLEMAFNAGVQTGIELGRVEDKGN